MIADGSGVMFDGIAARYDRLNRLLSFGLDQRWRRTLADTMPRSGRLLDLATGTADVALMLAGPDREVVGLDPSAKMLAEGRKKIGGRQITLEQGDAQALPFADDSFDGICMAFGIRNVPDRDLALREMARVARPGAVVSILELSEPKGLLTQFHSRAIAPLLGAALSEGAAYRYLKRSVQAFPSPPVFGAQMETAGLAPPTVIRLSFGAAWLFVSR